MKKMGRFCLLFLLTFVIGIASIKAATVTMPDPVIKEQDGESGIETADLIINVTEGSSNVNKIEIVFTLTNVTIQSITTEEGWYYTKVSDTEYVFETTKSSLAEGSHTIAHVTAKKIDLAQTCKIAVTPTFDSVKKSCTEFQGNYYDKDGNVVSEEKYKESCSCIQINGTYRDKDGNVVSKEEYEESCADNPKTGASIPLITLGALLVGGVALIAYSKKNKKFI